MLDYPRDFFDGHKNTGNEYFGAMCSGLHFCRPCHRMSLPWIGISLKEVDFDCGPMAKAFLADAEALEAKFLETCGGG